MKTSKQHWDSYGVFCIAQIIIQDRDLDEVWGEAIRLYEEFINSPFNVDTESELDCIHKFIQKEYNN